MVADSGWGCGWAFLNGGGGAWQDSVWAGKSDISCLGNNVCVSICDQGGGTWAVVWQVDSGLNWLAGAAALNGDNVYVDVDHNVNIDIGGSTI